MSVTLNNRGAKVDLSLTTAAAFARTMTRKTNGAVQDIAGYQYAAQIRDTAGNLAATFTCAIVDAATGKFSVALTNAQTAALVAGTTYRWDLEETVSGVTIQLAFGDVSVSDEVTA